MIMTSCNGDKILNKEILHQIEEIVQLIEIEGLQGDQATSPIFQQSSLSPIMKAQESQEVSVN